MCLVALALDQSRRFPLVIAANRDEFFKRPAARLAWWTPETGGPPVLSGRDLESGGTWMGLTAPGRLALVTNHRDPGRNDPQAPTRGRIVLDWLADREPSDRFWMRTALSGYNGFSLVAADFKRGDCFWASNVQAHPKRLERGLYGLSNAALDTPWPKVQGLKSRLREALTASDSVDALATQLFAALADRHAADDAELPSTGVPIAWERALSPAFIRLPEQGYGTRCSTLVITERARRHLITHVFERSFSAGAGLALLRRSTIRHWPPRYSDDEPARDAELGEVAESHSPPEAAQQPAAKKTRVRTLLKPTLPRRVRGTA
jgi:uncharacterized protein with NRDE domain